MKLSFEHLPKFIFSSGRKFYAGERHIERVIDESVLILMKKGELCFEEDGVPVRLKAHEYYIQRPNVYQTGKAASLSPEYYYVHFYGKYDETAGLPLRGTFNEADVNEYIERLETLGHNAPKLELHCAFYSLLLKLAGQSANTLAQKIKNYMIQNFDRPITLADLCSAFNFSKNHIIKVFGAQYHKSPYRFLTEYRLEKARQLLLTTNHSCEQIAAACGFETYSVFFKAFRSYYGVTPSRYNSQEPPETVFLI